MDRETRSEWKFALIGFFGVALPLYVLLDVWVDSQRALIAVLAIGIVLSVARAFWDQHRQWWFWAAVWLLIVAHAGLVLSSGDIHPTIWFVAPFTLFDFLAVYGFLWCVQKLLVRTGK